MKNLLFIFEYLYHVRMIEKKLREKNMSMYELARKIGESDQRTQYIVKKKDFTKDYRLLLKIAEALGCKVDDLLEKGDK